MKNIFKFIPLWATILILTVACQNNDEDNFSNKAFIDAKGMTSETIVKGSIGTLVKTISIKTARPTEKDIHAAITYDGTLLELYNKKYYTSAELLPDSCYKISESQMTINKGSVKSSEAAIQFQNLGGLDRSKVYVLPIRVRTTDIDLLSSAKEYYYVFKAGALINVVGDIEGNYLEIYPWKTPGRIDHMNKLTMEALVYPRELDKLISTIMGIEGKFLMRIGDAGLPPNQIQIATSYSNFTDSKLQLQTNTWQHVALTYDGDEQTLKVYINGKLMYEEDRSININLEGNGYDRNFLIGKSYDDTRDLKGYISEVRVWDVVRTQEEIASHIYNVEPTTTGLVAYWKFDDNSSLVVKDYSGNGNDLKANHTLSWKNVSLPAAK